MRLTRAVHAYMTMFPALPTIGRRDGSQAAFGKGYNVPGDEGPSQDLLGAPARQR